MDIFQTTQGAKYAFLELDLFLQAWNFDFIYLFRDILL